MTDQSPPTAGQPPDPSAAVVSLPAETQAAPQRRPPLGRVIIDAILDGNSAVVTALAIAAALIVGGLLIAFSDTAVLHAWSSLFASPGNAIGKAWDAASSAYSALFEGSIFNPHAISAAVTRSGSVAAALNPLSETAVNATPLIFTGLGVAVAFRAGLFNIGGTGQFIGGAIVATWLGFAVSLPPVVHVIVCVIGAFIGGAVIGWIVGALKARTGAHEVIVTIMLNYVMIYLLSYLLGTSALQRPGRTDLISPVIAANAQLPHIAGPNLRVNAAFLLALASAVAVWWLLSRSTVGFEFRAIGANPSAGRSAGMSVERTWMLAMLIAGGLAGLAGSALVQGTDYSLNFQSYSTYGFDGITVALLGRARPLGVVLSALLFGALHAGGGPMEAATGTPQGVVQVIQALVVLFVAAPALIRGMFRLRKAAAGGIGEVTSKGWNA
jgi:general nucleoside transport system permease protein